MGDGDHEEEFDILTKTGLKTGFSKPRAVLGSLLVRVELDKKSIDLDSILCPSCDNVVESVDHCLVLCEEALSVWDRTFVWWGVRRVDAFTLNDMICHRGGVGMEKEARVLLEVVLLVAAYYIWKSRNLRVFKAKNESSSKVFQTYKLRCSSGLIEDPKSISFLGKNRL
ncbi:reverse transcriptase domain, reverse transcriptase zinc-binding domain protein [Tanacetum coccineum]